MSERRNSALARYLRRKALKRLVAKVGLVKLAAAAAAIAVAFILLLALIATFAAATAQPPAGGGVICSSRPGKNGPPARLIPIYSAAAQRYHLGPRGPSILAAINFEESTYGTSTLPGVHSGSNSAGAAGPMQFLYPSSWEMFGVDGDGDGVKDVYDPADAIFSAANLLHAAGAPQDWYGAIFSYNHADWYVRDVLAKAKSLGGLQCTPRPALGPLPAGLLQRVIYVARWIQSQRIPYCWGGGHAAKPGPSPPIAGGYCDNVAGERVFGVSEDGLDCSGAVRWLLVLSGFKDKGPMVSGSFATAYPRGPGAHVTIWSNADHVFVTIDGVPWGTSSSNFRHGPGFGGQTTEGFTPSHPEGL